MTTPFFWRALAVALAVACPALADPCEAPLPKAGQNFSGPVRYVGDGDSLCVLTGAGLVEVRLADFYAPELQEPGGDAAKVALSRVAMGHHVECRAEGRSWDRVVAICTRRGVSLGDLMRRSAVREGGRMAMKFAKVATLELAACHSCGVMEGARD